MKAHVESELLIAIDGPHKGQPVLVAGERLEMAQAALVMLHGRGAGAQDILTLAPEVDRAGVVYLAPQAAQFTWYPNRFIVPRASNQPWLSSGLAAIGALLDYLQAKGLGPEQTLLLGFSQGACLALEYAARHPQRYAGVAGLSGGLIGAETELEYDGGSLNGAPVFLGCSDVDPHIPLERVQRSAEVLEALGAQVTRRIYPGLGHIVNSDEVDFVRKMLDGVVR